MCVIFSSILPQKFYYIIQSLCITERLIAIICLISHGTGSRNSDSGICQKQYSQFTWNLPVCCFDVINLSKAGKSLNNKIIMWYYHQDQPSIRIFFPSLPKNVIWLVDFFHCQSHSRDLQHNCFKTFFSNWRKEKRESKKCWMLKISVIKVIIRCKHLLLLYSDGSLNEWQEKSLTCLLRNLTMSSWSDYIENSFCRINNGTSIIIRLLHNWPKASHQANHRTCNHHNMAFESISALEEIREWQKLLTHFCLSV